MSLIGRRLVSVAQFDWLFSTRPDECGHLGLSIAQSAPPIGPRLMTDKRVATHQFDNVNTGNNRAMRSSPRLGITDMEMKFLFGHVGL